MSKARWFDIAASALAIAVLVGIGFVLRPQQTPTVRVNPSAAQVERPRVPAVNAPSVLFISDSYTSGVGLKESYYGCMAAVRMGWLCNLSAQPGTGYISGGPANRFVNPELGPSASFDERLAKLATTYRPDIVVLDGGRKDVFAPKDAEFAVMSSTLGTVRQLWPAAKIVLIRPRVLGRPTDDLGYTDDFIARLRAQPAAKDMTVVDPISLLSGTDTSVLLTPDGTLPNARGAAALSSALVDSLATNGFTVPRS